jgi:hypothetical protein
VRETRFDPTDDADVSAEAAGCAAVVSRRTVSCSITSAMIPHLVMRDFVRRRIYQSVWLSDGRLS